MREDDTKDTPSVADHVGQAAGGITGAVAGAAIGVTAGPLGVVLGGIAGAIGGWWSGRAIAEAAEDLTDAEDAYYRADFERGADRRTSDRRSAYEDVRQAYYLGDIAAANPGYASFADVERDLERGWRSSDAAHGEWQAVRGYASIGFDRGRDRRRNRRAAR